MTHVSRRKLQISTDKFLLDLVKVSFSNLKDSEVFGVLGATLSETELTMLKKRLGIILFLRKKLPVETVTDVFKVTRQTVLRISLFLKTLSPDNLKILDERLSKVFLKEEIKSFLNSINPSKANFKRKMLNLGYNF